MKHEGQQEPKESTPEGVRTLNTPYHGLFCIFRAYRRREITYNEWLKQSKEWAEQVIYQHGEPPRHS